jgi:PAS domain S-box-containing protein
MKFSLRRDLGLKLLALYLLFVGPVVLASLAFDRLAAQRLEADVKASDLALARAIAQETNTILDSAMQAVRQLGTYPEVITADKTGMESLFKILLSVRTDVNLIYRLDSNGVMIYHYPTGPGSTIGWDFSIRDYYQRALATHSPLFSKGRISPTTQQPVATAVMPLWDDNGKFLGLVATNIKLQTLSHTLASIAAEHRSEEMFQVSIIDSAGQVIANPSPPLLLNEEARSPDQVTQAVLSGQFGTMIRNGQDGEETLYSYVPIPSVGWGVIVSRPTAAAFASPRATHRGVLFSIAVFLVVGLFFWFALSRQVIQPLERLASYSQTIGLEKQFDPAQRRELANLAKRPDQIGHLIRSLERMEEAIEARLQELSTLLQTSAAVISTLDSQTVLNRILEQVERLMSINMCAVVALDQETGVFRAQASRGLSQRYTEQLAINPSEPLSVTLRAIRSGSPIQVCDTELDESFAPSRPRARSEGYRSLLAVPLNTHHAPPSALLVYRRDPHTFSEREINLLTSFANHATMAIENATLYARSDTRLQEQTRRLEALIQSLQDGLILEDLQGRVLYANRRLSELVNQPPEEITGNHVNRFFERLLASSADGDLKQKEKNRALVESALNASGKRSIEIQIGVPRQARYLRLQFFDVTDPQGMTIGRGQILRDITQNKELDRMKSSLISTVSHELRTPLAAIKGYVTTLLAEDVEWDSGTQHEFLEIISSEADRLSSLVNDLLDMSRIEAGNLDVRRAPCDLKELVSRAAQRAHPNPNERLQVNLPEHLPPLLADPQRIEAVLRNLIENAAKYTDDQSPILVSATVQSRSLVIRVEDRGPGIPAEHSQLVFESFYRVENGLARDASGAGLGLAICQGFVRAHGGEIWLEPRPKGTCVAFSLPLEMGTKSMLAGNSPEERPGQSGRESARRALKETP